ncbi:MAG TPA: BON domain-containing protein, partial [Steroidobacteraceae bacterium]|nr:BON domain-containing protein [Steroidobacteraceae bacterium]
MNVIIGSVWTTYALSPYLRANDLKVSVHSGKATLSGTVEEGVNKDLAKQIALGVNGIKDVDNNIVVKADYVAPARSANRSYGETVDDMAITAAVKSKLTWNKYTDGLNINVNTTAGKVTLKGSADTDTTKELAKQLALSTRGVVAVNNELIVDGKQAIAKTKDASSSHEMSDSWITTKVKSTFMYSSNVDGVDISVKTQGGVVTLTGKMDSGAERALA